MADKKPNYLRNVKTSNRRTVRLEIVGGVSESEKHFLNGMSLMVAGTMSKDDEAFTAQVSHLVANLIRGLVSKMQQGGKEVNSLTDYFETSSNELSETISTPWKAPKNRDVTADANAIRPAINAFVKKLNALIGQVFTEETAKGTRSDLILTMVVAGLAFTLANAYHLITRNFKIKMTSKEFKGTFIGMYDTAIKDIGKNEPPEEPR